MGWIWLDGKTEGVRKNGRICRTWARGLERKVVEQREQRVGWVRGWLNRGVHEDSGAEGGDEDGGIGRWWSRATGARMALHQVENCVWAGRCKDDGPQDCGADG